MVPATGPSFDLNSWVAKNRVNPRIIVRTAMDEYRFCPVIHWILVRRAVNNGRRDAPVKNGAPSDNRREISEITARITERNNPTHQILFTLTTGHKPEWAGPGWPKSRQINSILDDRSGN